MKKQIVSIALLNLINILGFALLIPVMPFVVEDLGYSSIVYGILIATYPFFQFIGAPILGTLSDFYGRRPILLISQLGTTIAWVIFALSSTVPQTYIGTLSLPLIVIAISRIVDGITGGNFSVANAYISDITTREQRTKLYGLLGAVIGIGIIIGPVAGGYLMSLPGGYVNVSIVAFILSCVTLVMMYFQLDESLMPKNKARTLDFNILHEINIISKIIAFKNPQLKKLFMTRLFFALTFSSYTSTIVLFMKDVLALNARDVGLVFLVLGSFFIVNQAVSTPWLAKRYGDLKTFYIGQFCMMFGLLLVTTATSVLHFILVAYVLNLGFSVSFPTFKTIITSIVDEKRQGAVTGVDESVLAGASAIAPLVASVLYTYTGRFSYGFIALFILVPFGINYMLSRRFTIALP